MTQWGTGERDADLDRAAVWRHHRRHVRAEQIPRKPTLRHSIATLLTARSLLEGTVYHQVLEGTVYHQVCFSAHNRYNDPYGGNVDIENLIMGEQTATHTSGDLAIKPQTKIWLPEQCGAGAKTGRIETELPPNWNCNFSPEV